ncbi:E3 UBIQUITIN-PROTEIN LIGASE RING1 [Salix purpurea]|uniref:RING-type E3 ubiquitin transferase n=1 Tax=Salix purpurea TaxID=77065 RepID=A0A9Q0WYL4_SALPP|nr:E3 UBIQUITIN-PROTEIN LIGASE RING1 [Salix purpurea]
MSFTGAPPAPGVTAATTTTPKQYFCYKCSHAVSITVSPSDDPFCPICHDSFIEELEAQNPQNRNPISDSFFNDPFDPFSSLFPLLFQNSGNISQPEFRIRSEFSDPSAFDPLDFLRSHLQSLHSGGARVQFVIENNGGEQQGGLRFPGGNFGDYFIGSGLEQLIQQLAENDPNRYGTPPASKTAIEALPTMKVSEEMMKSEMNNQCSVCKDEFESGEEVKGMPCKHVFHEDCIMPWLKMHNSCPVCRYELPTDDPDYENRTTEGQGSGGGGSGGVERRFTISIPWELGGGGGGQSSS